MGTVKDNIKYDKEYSDEEINRIADITHTRKFVE